MNKAVKRILHVSFDVRERLLKIHFQVTTSEDWEPYYRCNGEL
jgi:hypothetical protein